MKQNNFFARVQAAYSVSIALEAGKKPSNADLISLGIPVSAKAHFKR
jgi:hypothetical protein